MRDSRWPNLFVVGAAKAGTTSVNHYLSQHPEIFMSPMKEPHFFSRIEPTPELQPFFPHVRDKGAYLSLFAGARDQQMRGEASTSYLTDPAVADRIWRTCPGAKIVMILRDPVDRAYSHYWNDVREGIERRPFGQAISEELEGPPGRWGVSSLYVECGRYSAPVTRYLERFRANAIVLFFEELVADAPRTLERLFTFLNVDPAWATRIESESRNPFALPRNVLSRRLLGSGTARTVSRKLLPRSLRAVGRRHLLTAVEKPPLEPDLRQRLVELYRPDVDRLCDVLGRRPPWPAFEETGRSSSTKRLPGQG
jgi:hypothetical protein